MAKLINFYVKLLCIINQHYESVLLINNLYFILCTCMSLLHIYLISVIIFIVILKVKSDTITQEFALKNSSKVRI